MKKHFLKWWNEQTRLGDPSRRYNLVQDAYQAAWELQQGKIDELNSTIKDLMTPKIKQLHFKDGKFDATLQHEMFRLVVEAMFEQFKACGGANYVCWTLNHLESMDQYELTMQKKSGQTPSEQNARLKTEIIAMNVLIKDAYEFLDSYGVVYDAGDKRGITQQALFDRMREVLK